MTFEALLEELKRVPREELRAENPDYAEFVILASNLPVVGPVLEGFFGPPFKPAGASPSKDAQRVTDVYGGIQKNQILYYTEHDGASSCAMLWPWGDRTRVTVKIVRGTLRQEGARPARRP